MNVVLFVIAVAAALLMAGDASAQKPSCGSAAPRFERGVKFAGQIRRVTGPDTVCVGRERDPATWIDVRLQDVRPRKRAAPAATEALSRTLLNQYAVCEVRGWPRPRVVEGRVNAACRVRGIAVGAIVRKLVPDHYR